MSDFVGARLCPPLPAGCRRACRPRPGSRSAAGCAELLPSRPPAPPLHPLRAAAPPPARSHPSRSSPRLSGPGREDEVPGLPPHRLQTAAGGEVPARRQAGSAARGERAPGEAEGSGRAGRTPARRCEQGRVGQVSLGADQPAGQGAPSPGAGAGAGTAVLCPRCILVLAAGSARVQAQLCRPCLQVLLRKKFPSYQCSEMCLGRHAVLAITARRQVPQSPAVPGPLHSKGPMAACMPQLPASNRCFLSLQH